MKGLSDTYVESVIRAFAKGRMTAKHGNSGRADPWLTGVAYDS